MERKIKLEAVPDQAAGRVEGVTLVFIRHKNADDPQHAFPGHGQPEQLRSRS